MEMIINGLNLHNVKLAHTAGVPVQVLKEGLPQVAFAGRSNAGKSSLVNSLLGRKKLARVSGEPGKTITVNYYNVDEKLYLTDLPGYGYARRSQAETARWSLLTQTYFECNSALKLVLLLSDIKVGLTDDDAMMLDYLHHYGVPYAVIATKCDKPRKTELRRFASWLAKDTRLASNTPIVLYSSVTHAGREDVWDLIAKSTL